MERVKNDNVTARMPFERRFFYGLAFAKPAPSLLFSDTSRYDAQTKCSSEQFANEIPKLMAEPLFVMQTGNARVWEKASLFAKPRQYCATIFLHNAAVCSLNKEKKEEERKKRVLHQPDRRYGRWRSLV
jgi:hypothetical protein